MWPGQGLVPVSVSRVQDRAGNVPISSNAVGFHCSTARAVAVVGPK